MYSTYLPDQFLVIYHSWHPPFLQNGQPSWRGEGEQKTTFLHPTDSPDAKFSGKVPVSYKHIDPLFHDGRGLSRLVPRGSGRGGVISLRNSIDCQWRTKTAHNREEGEGGSEAAFHVIFEQHSLHATISCFWMRVFSPKSGKVIWVDIKKNENWSGF